MTLNEIVDLKTFPIADPDFRAACKAEFDKDGVFVMPGFVLPAAISAIRDEGEENRGNVYAKTEQHTVYLSKPDPDYAEDHARNRLVTSSKGCLTDDRVPQGSALRALYDDAEFRSFLCDVLGEKQLHEYADPLSSINLHFHEKGQELGWHFDNSSFSITLMVQAPEAGGQFEYVTGVRNADSGEMGFDDVADILDGKSPVKSMEAEAGTLVFFRGRNSIHRVAPNAGDRTRMLAVLAYNAEPGVSLSEAARMTFYGRLS
ncbi:2OG-Fe(II) oxygenase [Tropicibacter sp. R16_0]|uniref:HalD/BesD family halogenase n=1 Tax=Tropicibacter sp. R16_0 TaxID=2821102 RepID=UPI001ADCA150|nr:2OG-Fe(II) oxygenase [Tropicibacter sp. R16_0]MBO9449216.1 2OG-Fe(II) oxygenase [Tropicibacter sp. R16_0]